MIIGGSGRVTAMPSESGTGCFRFHELAIFFASHRCINAMPAHLGVSRC